MAYEIMKGAFSWSLMLLVVSEMFLSWLRNRLEIESHFSVIHNGI